MQIITVTSTKITNLSANITFFIENDEIRGDIEFVEQLADGIKSDIVSDFMLNAQGNLHIHNAAYLYFETPAYAYFSQGILKAIYQNARQNAPKLISMASALFTDDSFIISNARYLNNMEIIQRIAHLLEIHEFNIIPILEVLPKFVVNLDVDDDEFEEQALILLENMYQIATQVRENDDFLVSPKQLKESIKGIYLLIEKYRSTLSN